MSKNHCIILNKPYVGSYVNPLSGRFAHEAINFMESDQSQLFIYCNPYGQNVKDSKDLEIEYMLLTSPAKKGSFQIEYLIEIDKSLHHVCVSKRQPNAQSVPKKLIDKAKKEINETLSGQSAGAKSLDGITYGGRTIAELFSRTETAIPVTYLAKSIKKAKRPVTIDRSGEEPFHYNFQRNFGYVLENPKENKDDGNSYKTLVELISAKDNWEEVALERFTEPSDYSFMKPSFLDLIDRHEEEACYSSIVGELLSHNRWFAEELLRLYELGDKYWHNPSKAKSKPCQNYEVTLEKSISEYGRLDIFVASDDFRIIIENKIKSDIHFNNAKNQLEKYFEYYKNRKSNTADSEVRYALFILVPHEKVSWTKQEVSNCAREAAESFKVLDYKDISLILEQNRKRIKFASPHLLEDCINLIKRQSLTRKELTEAKMSFYQDLFKQKRPWPIKHKRG